MDLAALSRTLLDDQAAAEAPRFLQPTAASRETKRAVPLDGGGMGRVFLQAQVPQPPSSARPAGEQSSPSPRANRSAGTIGMEFNAFFEPPTSQLPEAHGWGNPTEVGLHPSRPTTASDGFVRAARDVDIDRPDFLPSLRPKPPGLGASKLKNKWKVAAKAVTAGRFREKLAAAAAARKAAKAATMTQPITATHFTAHASGASAFLGRGGGGTAAITLSATQRVAAHLERIKAQQQQQPQGGLGATLTNFEQRPATAPGGKVRGNVLAAALYPQSQALVESAPAWMKITPAIARAADQFETEQAGRFAKASAMHHGLSPRGRYREHSPRMDQAISWVTYDLTSNRYVPPAPKLRQAVAFKPRAKKPVKEPEKRNVWAARAEWADSKDMYDTEKVEEQRAKHDWPHIKVLLTPMFNKYMRSVGDVSQDVKDVVFSNQDILVKIFEFYASLNGSIHSISMNAWELFLNDFNLVDPKSKFCKRSDLGLLFISVDSATEKMLRNSEEEGQPKIEDEKKALGRIEFMAALVLLSVNKYILSGEADDPAESFFSLTSQDIEPAFDPTVYAASNAFRVAAYDKSVNDELLLHDESLRNIFSAMCGTDGRAKQFKIISMEIWIDFLRRLDLVGHDITVRDAKLCFTWSRMMVIDGSTSERGRRKEAGLPYEGFLEALCRLSVLKALPLDDEIDRLGFSDAGALYVAVHKLGEVTERLNQDALQEFKKALQGRVVPWGGEPLQPLSRAVAHLLAIIIRVIDARGNRDDLRISEKEAALIYARR